jgi:smoothened protein
MEVISSRFCFWVARKLNKEVDKDEPAKLKKHKVIAQAFAKRKMLNSDGRLSISIHNTYQDPVGE